MPLFLYLALLALWIYWAARAFARGETVHALILLVIGVALFAYRYSRQRHR